MAVQPAGQGFLVEGDQRADERAVVADHHALGDQRVRADRSSSTAGATFLPPAVTMISFLRPVMRQEAVLVERADVAGVEPAVVERLRGAASWLQ